MKHENDTAKQKATSSTIGVDGIQAILALELLKNWLRANQKNLLFLKLNVDIKRAESIHTYLRNGWHFYGNEITNLIVLVCRL